MLECIIRLGDSYSTLQEGESLHNPKGPKIFKIRMLNFGTEFVADLRKFQSRAISLFLDEFSQELVSGAVRFLCFGFYFRFFNTIER